MPLNRLHILCLTLFLALFPASAQMMPQLGVADEIKTGSFPNGLRYYIVVNAAEKGFADFALVRKSGTPDVSFRSLLDSLPHFGPRSPYRFLADNGVAYSPEGYVAERPEAGIVSLRSVPVYSQETADSTMLLLMDMAAASRSPQAVIVSGDIDVAKVLDRLDLLSMTVPRLRADRTRTDYRWIPEDSLRLAVTCGPTREAAVISAVYRARRMPEAMMNTLQPLVSQAYADMLGQIVSERLERSFRSRGVPLAEVVFDYHGSADGPGDEHYAVSLTTSAGHVAEATSILASVLSTLDREGASAAEFEDAKSRLKPEARSAGPRTNREYVARCVSAYLYGSNLASESSIREYLTGRSLSSARELILFNGFVDALLDSARNLSLHYEVPGGRLDAGLMRSTFSAAWASPDSPEPQATGRLGEVLKTCVAEPPRARLRSETAEPVSGGRLWTFANGIRTVFRKMDTGGEFRYALMLRDGIASVPGIGDGEGAFVGDMLALGTVAGVPGRDFLSMLEADGITMEFEAGLSGLRISGKAPEAKFPLLMQALLAISGERGPDMEEFGYYRSSEALRIEMDALSQQNVNSLMDSIMRPGYFYTGRKRIENLGEDLPERAEKYFASAFSRVNDGLLVLVGDLDEDKLKKELVRTLGGFSCHKQYARRPKVNSRFASGSVTYIVESLPGVADGVAGVHMGMSADIAYSIDNYIAFKAAVACIDRKLAGALAGCGAYLEIDDSLEVFPDERMWVHVSCLPCRSSGLPASVSACGPLEVFGIVRRVTSQLERIEISEAELRAFKEQLTSEFERMNADPGSIVDAVLLRYGDGKDLVSGFRRAVDGLTADDIRKILSDLQHGAGVEYVVL